MKLRKRYKIVGFYDSETCNVENNIADVYAFPILHQFGFVPDDLELKDIDSNNVENVINVKMYRYTFQAIRQFEMIIDLYIDTGIVPIIAIHNLSFDMYPLAEWLNSYNVRVLAKSSTKPISFTIEDENNEPLLILWDTLQFSHKGLERMGTDCGYLKLSGAWDYNLVRTPETPLTDNEIAYAEHDIYTLAAWLGFWCRNNPEIDERDLGVHIVTKTGIVRAKRRILFDGVKAENNMYNVGRYWHYLNKRQQPKTDDELFTMQACTRGGFTFCSSHCASKVYDLDSDYSVFSYDATSMHPSQMVSHLFPCDFKEASVVSLKYASENIRYVSINRVLKNWHKPFTVAFNAKFKFTNLHLKKDSPFDRWGISPLAWARISKLKKLANEDNEAQDRFKDEMNEKGYKDVAKNCEHVFGKLVKAENCELFLTELAFWEICQCFDFDSVEPIYGYISNRFCKPSDLSILSVMHFYKAKNVFKKALHEYEQSGIIHNKEELAKYASVGLVEEMANGKASLNDVRLEMQNIKANLNALFGVECTNEFRIDSSLNGEFGIVFNGKQGICNAPKNSKSWYQFGQRIVGWSRIVQNIAIQLIAPHVNDIICGDTDSLKICACVDNKKRIEKKLNQIGQAIDKGKNKVLLRVKSNYPQFFDELKNIGYYVFEFETKQFCAAWNKAYVMRVNGNFDFTIAGISTNKRYVFGKEEFANSYNDLADRLYSQGYDFARICNLLLGYNVQIDSSITKINGRKIPMWGSSICKRITDYNGNSSLVTEPQALALYNIPKAIGSLNFKENVVNAKQALVNNPDVNVKDIVVKWQEFEEPRFLEI